MVNSESRGQRGAAAIFIVAFFTLLIGVIVVSFANIVIQSQKQSLNNDLSQSAYDAAMGGNEDALRALKWYAQKCNNIPIGARGANEADCKNIEDGKRCNLQNVTIDKRSEILPGTQYIDNEVRLSQSSNDDALDQAYSCVRLKTVTSDAQLDLWNGKSASLIPLKTVNNDSFDTIDLHWHTVGEGLNVAEGTIVLDNVANASSASLPQSGTQWNNHKPPIIRIEIIPVMRGNITISDTDNQTKTLFLYPSSSAVAATSVDVNGTDDRLNPKINLPQPVRCNTAAVKGQYVCGVKLVNLNYINGDSANTDFYVRVTSLYNNTTFKMELYQGATLRNLNNVAPLIETTGRANDVYRHIQTRVMTETADNPTKDGGFDVTQGVCKNFQVPEYTDDCPVGSNTRFDE